MTHFIYDDGGRSISGFTGARDAGDCVTRAIAIATQQPYREVYDSLAVLSRSLGGKQTARDGVRRKVYDQYLLSMGWEWTPTMRIGAGCTIHLTPDELPGGRLVVRVSKHMCAVVNGVVHDTTDPSRDGTRCVYGYWSQPR